MPRQLRSNLTPDEAFKASAKDRFLASYDTARPNAANGIFANRFTFASRAVIAIVALLALTAGATVFAEADNVSATNPLYPLKRLGENVELAFASSAEKPALELSFAAKRADEIATLKERSSTSTIIVGLTADLDGNISSSLNSAEEVHLRGDSLTVFCQNFLAMASSSTAGSDATSSADSASINERLFAHPELFARFAEKCQDSVIAPVMHSAPGSSTTTLEKMPNDWHTTSTATSTVSMPPQSGSEKDHGKVIIGVPSTTSVSASATLKTKEHKDTTLSVPVEGRF